MKRRSFAVFAALFGGFALIPAGAEADVDHQVPQGVGREGGGSAMHHISVHHALLLLQVLLLAVVTGCAGGDTSDGVEVKSKTEATAAVKTPGAPVDPAQEEVSSTSSPPASPTTATTPVAADATDSVPTTVADAPTSTSLAVTTTTGAFTSTTVARSGESELDAVTAGPSVAAIDGYYPTDAVTPPGEWRYAERFWGYRDLYRIKEAEVCGETHTYATLLETPDAVEYLMMFGEDGSRDYSRLVLRGRADDPAPVEMDIYIDGQYAATASWDRGDRCNQDATVEIPGIRYGTHAIAVVFTNDSYEPDKPHSEADEIDRNLHLDGLLVEEIEHPSVTVAVHGGNEPLDELVSDLHTYWDSHAGGASIYLYDQNSGDLVLDRGSHSAANKVVRFEWFQPKTLLLKASNACASGMDEAAGDALFVMLIEHDLLDSDYLHLIGYSRGTVVVSEAAQRLLYHGFRVDHVTYIDPEPGEGLHNDAGPPKAWEGIGFVDNYYGDGTVAGSPMCGMIYVLGAEGEISGAYNEDVGGDHYWPRRVYQDSVLSHIDSPQETRFGLRANPQRRRNVAETGERTPVGDVPLVVNGDFSYHDNAARDEYLAGWAGHGGGGGGERWDDGFLRLSLGRDEGRTHNRMYIPPDATHLEFDMQRTNRDGGLRRNDRLEVLIGDHRLGLHGMGDTDNGFRGKSHEIPQELRGGVHTLTFRLIDVKGNRVNSVVRIDNVRLTTH